MIGEKSSGVFCFTFVKYINEMISHRGLGREEGWKINHSGNSVTVFLF